MLLNEILGCKGPGLFILMPFIDEMVIVDLRMQTLDVLPQDVITKDSVSVKVNAVVWFRVFDPAKAVINVERYIESVYNVSQTTLRSVLGENDLDGLLAQREAINDKLRQILDDATDDWGM